MKKDNFRAIVIAAFIVFSGTALLSFSGKWGGDVFEIYLNGKRVLQQFVHVDKSVKTLQLTSVSNNDKIDVYYSHCGHTGTNRVLTVRDETNKIIKQFKFTDAANTHSAMSFTVKDVVSVQKNNSTKLNLYYSSKELPAGSLLATIAWTAGEHTAAP